MLVSSFYEDLEICHFQNGALWKTYEYVVLNKAPICHSSPASPASWCGVNSVRDKLQLESTTYGERMDSKSSLE